MSLLKKIFGGSSSKKTKNLVEEVVEGIIERANFDISFDLKEQANGEKTHYKIDFFGADEDMFTNRDGSLLDSFQLFVRRVLQHHFPEESVNISCDCNGFREKADQSLVDLAEKLKKKALDQGKSVYVRALPPKDRKVIHQFLANDKRVKSRSVGDGLYKKIKIFPIKQNEEAQATPSQ